MVLATLLYQIFFLNLSANGGCVLMDIQMLLQGWGLTIPSGE